VFGKRDNMLDVVDRHHVRPQKVVSDVHIKLAIIVARARKPESGSRLGEMDRAEVYAGDLS